MKLLLLSLLLSGLVPLGLCTTNMQSGYGTFLVSSPTDYLCKAFTFPKSYFLNTPHVQLSLRTNTGIYEAAVAWVEQAAPSGFTACVTASGPISGNSRTITLQWMSYTSVLEGRFTSTQISMWTAGTKCTDIDFAVAPGTKVFTNPPYVYVTPVHSDIRIKQDAASIWAEDVTISGFKICMRELRNFDGIHKNIYVNWLALEKAPDNWNIGSENVIVFPNTETLTRATHYSFCKTTSFAKKFYQTPTMITTVKHNTDVNNPKAIKPDHNAITEWVDNVSPTDFKVCLKDIQPYDKHHDPVTVSYMAIGYLDPCLTVQCKLYATCRAYGPQDARCECPFSCPDYEALQCGSNGITYRNTCYYKKHVCESQDGTTTIVHAGACYPFILHHGRVALNLATTEVQCKLVQYAAQNFAADRTVHVQVSVNYFNTLNTTFVHDAAVAWAEKISIHNFTVCALKAGRNDRTTPDNGATYVDYMAYQGSPAGAVAGEVTLANWWEGTTCMNVSLPEDKFNVTPNALVSSEHMVAGEIHDAATIWLETTSSSQFKVCLREMQNFDGLHENIHVNWLAFDTLPNEMNAEKFSMSFPNTYLPKVADNFAYCQDGLLSGNYTKAPTMIASARHAAGIGALLPVYNSISVWIEQITTSKFRVCLKELHTPNGYDPVEVTVLAIGG